MFMWFLLFALCGIYWIYLKRKFNYWNQRNVLNNNPITPAGDLVSCMNGRKNFHVLLSELYKKCKDMGHDYYGFYFSVHPVLIPVDIDLIKKILITDFDHFNTFGIFDVEEGKDRYPILDNFYTADVNRWKYTRNILNSNLGLNKIKRMADIVTKYSNECCDIIAKQRTSVDINNIATRYSLDVASTILLGVNEHCLSRDTSPIISFAQTVNRGVVKTLLKTLLEKKGSLKPEDILKGLFCTDEINTFLSNYMRSVHKQRLENGVDRDDLFNIFLKNVEDEGEPYDFNKLVSDTAVVLIASFDSTSYIISYALYELGKKTDLQDRARAEIVAAIQSSTCDELDSDAIWNLKFLDRFILEICRVHPLVPLLTRYCVKDYQVPGRKLIIEQGTRIFVSTLGVHQDSQFFPKAEEFNPDRFLDTEQRLRLLIFGAGPKTCPGYKLGTLIIKTLIVNILLKYQVTLNAKMGPVLESSALGFNFLWKYKTTIYLDFTPL